MKLYLGVDGGGSSLRARARDEIGRVVFEAREGAGSWTQTPRELLRARLSSLVEGRSLPDRAVLGLAGLLTPQDREEARDLAAEAMGMEARRVLAVADYEIALAAAPQGTLALVIAGTGSLVCSPGARTSGGGPLLGDPGSVYSLCRSLISAMTRRPSAWPKAAWSRLFEAFEAGEPDEAVARFYLLDDRARRACRMVDVIRDMLSSDDRVTAIVEEGMAGLASLAFDHLEERSLPRRGCIALTGGLWEALPMAQAMLQEKLGPDLRLFRLDRDPVEGAIALAAAGAPSQNPR